MMKRSYIGWGIVLLLILLLGLVVWFAWGKSPLVHVNEGLTPNFQVPVATTTPGGDTTIGDNPVVTPAKQCVRAGCSSQLCVDSTQAADIVTTCEYREVYACYAAATCEVQPTGDCGFTETEELNQCVLNAN